MPGAESCSQGQTQDGGVTHGPCHPVAMVALVVTFWVELRIAAMGPWDPPKVPAPSFYHSPDGVRGRGRV